MPQKFDVTEMRAHLDDYAKELNDLLTTRAELDRFAEFNMRLSMLNGYTKSCYQMKEDGTYPALTEEELQIIRENYQAALDQVSGLLAEPGEGPAAIRMRGIVRELAPMLRNDLAALQSVKADEPTSLPELISKARQTAVDLGSQVAPTVGGNTNSRHHIRVAQGDELESGFFTETVTVDPQGDFQRLLNRMKEKYPDYRGFLDQIGQQGLQNAAAVSWNMPYERLNPEDAPEAKRSAMLERVWNDTIAPMELEDSAEPLRNRPDFLPFMDELSSGMRGVVRDYGNFKVTQGLEDGANVDRRNIAMYRVAALLGKKNLVAEARPMLVIRNGQTVNGTFMEEVYGDNIMTAKAGDPLLSYTAKNFENPAVMDDIAAMQAIDFICGNQDRNLGNIMFRFEPKGGANARLTGISLIDNDASFPPVDEAYGGTMVEPKNMGVVGEDFYNAMRRLTTIDQFRVAVADLGLSDAEIQSAWNRKEALQAQIEADKAYFAGKPIGYTEAGRIRLVPATQWRFYTMQKLAQSNPESKFATILTVPEEAKGEVEAQREEGQARQRREANRRQVLGLPPVEAAPQADNAAPPVGVVVGNGLQQETDPLNINRPETLKLTMPDLSTIKPVGGALSKRYPVTWKENGVDKTGFVTLGQFYNLKSQAAPIFRNYEERYPQYAAAIRRIRDYYAAEDEQDMADISEELTEQKMELMGFSAEEAKQLLADSGFRGMKSSLSSTINTAAYTMGLAQPLGVTTAEGKRLDMRNVAMTNVAEALGAPTLLARSRPLQMESGGRILEGVVMESADGVNLDQVADGHPMARITEDKIDAVYNNASGLKSLADLQIVDYVCMNIDRHSSNMFYRFEGLETGNPKFIGVQGIDHDFAFGDRELHPDSRAKCLPALNDLQVVTEAMAARLRDPKTEAEIEAKMRANHMTEGEITGAKARLHQLQEAIRDKRIQVVPEKEWGKGPYSFQSLAKKPGYYGDMKVSVIQPMAEKAAAYYALPENERPVYTEPKPLTYGKALAVEDFGAEYKKTLEFKELERQAELEFRKGIEAEARQATAPTAANEKDMLAAMQTAGREMYDLLDSADPWNHGTSKTYKELKRACTDLEKLAKKLGKKLRGPEDNLKSKDRQKLAEQFNKLRDKAAAYTAKKTKEQDDGYELSDVGQARLNQTASVAKQSKELRKSYQLTVSAAEAKKDPQAYAHKRLKEIVKALPEHDGQSLRKRVAEVLCYKALTTTDYTARQKGLLKNAVQAETMLRQRERLMNTPAFKRLAALPDDELRQLAGQDNGEQLKRSYIRELARDKETELHEQARQEKAEPALQNQARRQEARNAQQDGPAIGKQ